MPNSLSFDRSHSEGVSSQPDAPVQQSQTGTRRATTANDRSNAAGNRRSIADPGSFLAGLPARVSTEIRHSLASFRQGQGLLRPMSMPAASTSSMQLQLLERRPSETSAPSSPLSPDNQSSRSTSSRSSLESRRGDALSAGTPRPAMDLALDVRSQQVSARTSLDLEAAHETQASSPSIRRASFSEFLGMQVLRHLGPVGLVALFSQGVVGHYMGKLFDANENTALGVQAGLAALSLVHQIASRWHTESNANLASRAFLGGSMLDSTQHTPRRVWQELERLGVLTSEAGAVIVTFLARSNPRYAALASELAAAQVNGHVFPALREFFSPLINTGHVGHPDAPLPESGKNLRPNDLGWQESLGYGTAVSATEFGVRVLMEVARPASPNTLLAASIAAALEGLRKLWSSAVEDTLIATAEERNLRRVDPRHVRSIQLSSHNPLSTEQLGRQFERVETRKFNTLVPAMLAITALYFIEPLLDSKWQKVFAAAVVYALTNGSILGADLSLTARSYQMNDALRHHRDAMGGTED